jgi:DNA-binding transcriptional MerR regulator
MIISSVLTLRYKDTNSSALEVKGRNKVMLDIGEVTQATGLSASALRFYEEKGLITSVARRGLRRQFDDDVVERVALIILAQNAGFSLNDIGKMFGTDGQPHIDKAILRSKAAALDKTIARLTALRNGLQHAAECPAPSHLECPTFRRLLHVALKKRPKSEQCPQKG